MVKKLIAFALLLIGAASLFGCVGESGTHGGEISFPGNSATPAYTPESTIDVTSGAPTASQPIPTVTPTVLTYADEMPQNIPDSIELLWTMMPRQGATVALGQAFTLEGVIQSDTPISAVEVRVYDIAGDTLELRQAAESGDLGELIYDLNGGNTSISYLAPFSRLTEGEKRLELYVSNQTDSDVLLWRAEFTISEWVQLTNDMIHYIFVDPLREFFGDESYLFRFKVARRASRRIVIDEQWEKDNIISLTFNGRYYQVHRLAYDAFKNAFDHIRESYVSITYDDGTTGAFLLNDAMVYNLADGAYVPRFQDWWFSKVSHHSFGTCIDINSTLEVNQILLDENGYDTNWVQIERDIAKLTYDGLKALDGHSHVYCFTFDGNRQQGKLIPDTLLNYLLHEIAFAREGFSWGGYFGNGSDAMHFSLTEPNDYGVIYPDGSTATQDRQRVQKVFEYAP
ncbi:MAG: M15 family metallopeptidase [Clostridia bacterium]|nr:M15 family metallopeptidase [Clostridia bacterium]